MRLRIADNVPAGATYKVRNFVFAHLDGPLAAKRPFLEEEDAGPEHDIPAELMFGVEALIVSGNLIKVEAPQKEAPKKKK